MKKILFFALAITFGLNAYADGYNSYNIAYKLYQSGRYEEAKQRFMICVKYYPDDDLEWSIIYQRIKDCDAHINNKSYNPKVPAPSEERCKYELRKERKLIYISANASTTDGEYPDFKSDIVGALAPYGYKTTNNKEDAYWIVNASADVLKLSKSGENDPEHIVEVKAHYTIENVIEGYIPAGGESGLNEKGTSAISYNKASYDAYANLKNPMGKAINNAIENIIVPSESELENIIALVVTGDNLTEERLQDAEKIFQRTLLKYSDYKLVNMSSRVRNQRAEFNRISERYSSSTAMENAIGHDFHPRYICEINIKHRSFENDYSLSALITDLKTSGTEGISFYPLNATQSSIIELNSDKTYGASLYIIRDLHESVNIMSDEKFKKLHKEIRDYEQHVAAIEAEKKANEEAMNEKKNKTNLKAGLASFAVPGLGLVLKGHNKGYAYLGTEAVLCLGGVMLPELMRKSYINKRNHETSANNKDVYTTRANSCKKVSIICGACAGVLHVVNIVHSFMAKPESSKNPKIQWKVAATPLEYNFGNDYAMGLSLTYRF